MATSEAPAAVPVGTWKPRWRQSGAGPSVKFYTTSEISTAFDCPCNHTFITGRPGPVEGEITETEAPPVLLVMNHLKANPNAPTELWTRNSFPSISRSLHSVVPFFSESTVMRRKYELTGWFELERAELVKGGSEAAKAFVMAREESKGVKSPEAWASALRDDWLKVTLKKSKIEATRSPRLTSDHPLPHPDRSTPLKSLPSPPSPANPIVTENVMSTAQHFHKDTEAEEVADFFADEIKDKTVLITGASGNSIGVETARVIAKHDPKLIILAGRNLSRVEDTIALLNKRYPKAQLKPLRLDLGSLQQVREAAREVLSWPGPIDILINNAGIMATPYEKTPDGFEWQFGTNHLGHFLFTNLIMPKLLESKFEPRIISLSSSTHKRSDIRWNDIGFNNGKGYNKHIAYAQSKTANALFAVELASRFKDRRLTAFSPGIIPTGLVRNWEPSDYEHCEAAAPGLFSRDGVMNPKHHMTKSYEAGAATTIRAAFDPQIAHLSGSYFADCQPAEDPIVSAHALDKNSASRLWKMSEDLVGESFN